MLMIQLQMLMTTSCHCTGRHLYICTVRRPTDCSLSLLSGSTRSFRVDGGSGLELQRTSCRLLVFGVRVSAFDSLRDDAAGFVQNHRQTDGKRTSDGDALRCLQYLGTWIAVLAIKNPMFLLPSTGGAIASFYFPSRLALFPFAATRREHILNLNMKRKKLKVKNV